MSNLIDALMVTQLQYSFNSTGANYSEKGRPKDGTKISFNEFLLPLLIGNSSSLLYTLCVLFVVYLNGCFSI